MSAVSLTPADAHLIMEHLHLAPSAAGRGAAVEALRDAIARTTDLRLRRMPALRSADDIDASLSDAGWSAGEIAASRERFAAWIGGITVPRPDAAERQQ